MTGRHDVVLMILDSKKINVQVEDEKVYFKQWKCVSFTNGLFVYMDDYFQIR
jgi:hypothetical protein